MKIIETMAMISLNETLIAELVSFLIFLFLINRIMIRPLQDTMKKRREYIGDMENRIQESTGELQKLNRDLKEHESALIREANSEKDKLKNDGSRQAEKILEEARQEIQNIRGENQKVLEREVSETRKHIETEAEKLSVKIMENILDRGVSRG
ncbi:MAG: ATP synthase F0 subunit B [Desulfobacteraceae bacterium]|nr:ATP synthase F0 subunit B [Desulfobacteraceae bacterium]